MDEVLEWWREKNGGFCSRLILVLDTENSLPWVRAARGVDELFVAVQGAELRRTADAEYPAPKLGDFTTEWVEFNCDPNSDVQWAGPRRSVLAAYGVSKCWSDYTLHLPTGSDVTKHWKTYFPKVTYPLVYLANWCGGLKPVLGLQRVPPLLPQTQAVLVPSQHPRHRPRLQAGQVLTRTTPIKGFYLATPDDVCTLYFSSANIIVPPRPHYFLHGILFVVMFVRTFLSRKSYLTSWAAVESERDSWCRWFAVFRWVGQVMMVIVMMVTVLGPCYLIG